MLARCTTKSISVFLCLSFFPGQLLPADPHSYKDNNGNLATQSVFQDRMMTGLAEEYKGDVERSGMTAAAVLIIGRYLLSDSADTGSKGLPLKNLETVMREELKVALDGILLSRVKVVSGVVEIPLKEGGKDYVVRVAVKAEGSVSPEGNIWEISPRYYVTREEVVAKAEAPREMTAAVDVGDFTSERGPTTKISVAEFPDGIEVFPVFQPTLVRSWGMQRDRVPMHFTYQIEGREIVDADDKFCRQDTWEIEAYVEQFRKDHPAHEIVGMTGNGNIMANAGLVCFVNGKLRCLEQEKEIIKAGKSRLYPALVRWKKDGRYSVEEISVARDERIMLKGRDITDDIIFASSGVGILKNSKKYDMVENYWQDYDLRHYIDFPFMPSVKAPFGISQFYDEKGGVIKDIAQRAIAGEAIALDLAEKGERFTPEQIAELERNMIEEKNYRAAPSKDNVGYGEYFIDAAGGKVIINFFRGVHPNNMAAIDKEGNLVWIVVSGKSSRAGITFKEAQEKFLAMGYKDVIVFDNGADAMMRMNGEEQIASFEGRTRYTGIFIFARPKERVLEAPVDGAEKELAEYINNSRTKLVNDANDVARFLAEKGVPLPGGAGAQSSPYIKRDDVTAKVIAEMLDIVSAVGTSADRNVAVPGPVLYKTKELAESLDKLWAESIVEGLLVLGRKAKSKGDKLVIGLDNNWVPGYGKSTAAGDAISPLIKDVRSLGRILRSKGLDNVVVVERETDETIDVLSAKIDANIKTPGDYSSVVLLGSMETLGFFKDKYAGTRADKKPFVAGVDNKELLSVNTPGEYPLVRVIEMLSIALELAAGRSAASLPMVLDYDPKQRTLIFLPKAEPLKLEELIQSYKLKRIAVKAA